MRNAPCAMFERKRCKRRSTCRRRLLNWRSSLAWRCSKTRGQTVLVAVAALTLSASCGHKAEEDESEATAVPTIVADTAKVSRKTLVDELTVRGAVAALPNEDVKVSSLVPGRVMSVTV